MRKHNVEYGAYYRKKYNGVPKHQHKRALALTSRKFVRLVYGLLARNNCTPAYRWIHQFKILAGRTYVLL